MNKELKKVIILEMEYKEETHLFIMKIREKETMKEAQLAIRATDFGIPKDSPKDLISIFCQNMTGKEKNLFVEIDDMNFSKIRKEGEEVSDEEMMKLHENLDQYPYYELMKELEDEKERTKED